MNHSCYYGNIQRCYLPHVGQQYKGNVQLRYHCNNGYANAACYLYVYYLRCFTSTLKAVRRYLDR
jgi:hypothetical protein